MTISVLSYKTGSVPGNAAAFVIVENTSKNQRLHLESLLIAVTTDATVVNRYAQVSVRDRNNDLIAYMVLEPVAANGTTYHSLSRSHGSHPAGNNWYSLPKMWLNPYEKVTVFLSGGVAGDGYWCNVEVFNEKVAFSL